MARSLQKLSVTIDASAAVSDAIDFRNYAGGMILMPAAWTVADIGFKVCGSGDGTFAPLKDRSNAYGTDVSIDGPVASAAYPIPPFVFAAPYVQLWSHDGSGNDTNQAAERTLIVYLKD